MIFAELTYSAPEVLLIIAGIGGLLTGVGASIVSIVTAINNKGRFDKTDDKVDQVHKLTNDRAMKQDDKISSLETVITKQGRVIADLVAVIATKDKDAAVLKARTQQAPKGDAADPIIVELATTDVHTGEELATKDDMLNAVEDAKNSEKGDT